MNLESCDFSHESVQYLEELKIAVKEYVKYYNYQRPYKSLGFKTLFDFEEEYYKKS